MTSADTALDHASADPRPLLAALGLATLLPALGTSVAAVALPTLAQAFDAGVAGVQWVVLAYLIAITVLVAGAGRLGDLAGRRRLLLAGIAVFAIFSALCGLAPTLGWLVAARAGQGAGAALMMALALALASEQSGGARTGTAVGLLATMSALGTALGPSLGGLLIAGFGWQAVFLVNLPLSSLAALLAWRAVPADRPRAVVATSPIRFDSLRAPALRARLAITAILATVMMATLIVGPFHLSHRLGLDAAQVGLAVAVGPIVTALAGIPAGRIVDRFGASRLSRAGLVVMAAGAALLALGPETLGGYLGPLVILTIGYALVQTANTTAVMAQAAPDHRGAISGMLNLSRNLGLIGGASLMGAIFAAAGMRVTFALAGALVVAALAIVPRARPCSPERSNSAT